jgi:hypothetical protein
MVRSRKRQRRLRRSAGIHGTWTNCYARRKANSLMADANRPLVFGYVGFLYGAVLSCLGLFAAGGGHGSPIVAWLASSPVWLGFYLLPEIEARWQHTVGLLVLLLCAIFWSLLGAVLGSARHRQWRIIFLVMILAHYAAVFIAAFHGFQSLDREQTMRVLGIVVSGLAVYGLGQIAIWTGFAIVMKRNNS